MNIMVVILVTYIYLHIILVRTDSIFVTATLIIVHFILGINQPRILGKHSNYLKLFYFLVLLILFSEGHLDNESFLY